ncbi:type IV toxin-antitoxin system AbiEi family antitoxin domain-containing protein [Arthrobacter sp. H5]|uniref:type IV toxin-antitoxin system AbiEi family antitoxin domain-containing protein n=1 Tax=Arthrobacter sp. H5 TaxID=1267973 RepID=UPI0004837D55|nr:type IV toxin-antitoxin system AbiEi family antitoxin domain-containing protein [Arthrobacter sp. H5]
MDMVKALAAQGGVARRRDLAQLGISTHQLTHALAANLIGKPARGVYSLPDADRNLLAAKCAGSDLACISAAKRLDLWILKDPVYIHVSVDHGRPLPDEFRVHRSAIPLTPLDICVQCLRCLPELDALCIVESAVVKKLVTLGQLRSRLHSAKDGRIRRVVDLVDPHSQSIMETVARYHLRAAELSVQTQVYVSGVGRAGSFCGRDPRY